MTRHAWPDGAYLIRPNHPRRARVLIGLAVFRAAGRIPGRHRPGIPGRIRRGVL